MSRAPGRLMLKTVGGMVDNSGHEAGIQRPQASRSAAVGA